MMKRFRIAVLALAVLAAPPTAAFFDEADALFGKLTALCGQAFAGRVATDDPRDADMTGKTLVMHVRTCTDDVVRVPFHVGEDRSRTWVISRTKTALRLKHDHRHEDGLPDEVTMYGGDAVARGTAMRQEFPVDDESKAMFRANGLDASVTNVWAVELVPGKLFAYELRREGRFFRVEFDLTQPVAAPPPPWGAE